MPQTFEYVLADGQTKLPLRGVTLHKDDDAARRLMYEAEHLLDAVEARVSEMGKATDAATIGKLGGVASELRMMRDGKFREFMVAMFGSKFGTDDIQGKIIPQCTEADMSRRRPRRRTPILPSRHDGLRDRRR